MRLAAGLRPNLLGELQRSPVPLTAIGGGILFLREREKGERKGKEGEERGGLGQEIFQ